MLKQGWKLISREQLREAEEDLRRCLGPLERLSPEAPLLTGLLLEPALMVAVRDDRLTAIRAEVDAVFRNRRQRGWRHWGARPLVLDRLLAPAPVEG